MIDAAEWVGGIEDMRLGFHNVWKIHYTPGMHEPATVGDLLLNKDVWTNYPPTCKRSFELRPPRHSSAGGYGSINNEAYKE